jgi:putative ABC transport system permease protein
MTPLLGLAARSAWNRRFALGLVVLAIALSTFLMLGIERLRQDLRSSFAQSVSGTDLVVGARTGPVQLLLYAVFHLGQATQNIRYASVQALAAHRAVAWVVPVSLGDSHRGFAVLGTTPAYFEHFRHGQRQPLVWAQGTPGQALGGLHDAVIGSEVAQRLGYQLGSRIVLSHGDGALQDNDHDDQPFTVTGILQPTGTPVDRTVHVSLAAIEALHQDWATGMHLPGSAARLATSAASAPGADLTPRQVTAALVGLKSRAAVLAVQREVAAYRDEPLLAILPGVALGELWDVLALGEQGLRAMSALVAVVSLASLVAVILAGLNERRRELAILRAVGAGPRQVLWLLALEGGLVTALGAALGVLGLAVALWVLGPWLQSQWGLQVHWAGLGGAEWRLLAAVLAGGFFASLLPGWRAYRLALVDGLSPRI